MQMGLIGKKCGMTRVFNEDGSATPVTVIEVIANKISQVKTQDNDGYDAVQVAYGSKRASLLTKARSGHLAKAGCEPCFGLHEFRVTAEDIAERKAGDEIKIDIMTEGQAVDVSGVSKGKGFAGAVKRHNFKMQDATHGNSVSHRAPGSTGQCQTPGRVFKGKKMAGHMGAEKVSMQNLKVVKVDNERQLVLVSGAVPGFNGQFVVISPAVKKQEKK